MSHTPGPWRFVNGYAIIDVHDKVIAMVSVDSPDSTANAYAITAVPDLIVAVKAAWFWIEAYIPVQANAEANQARDEMLAILHTTLAKAEGK